MCLQRTIKNPTSAEGVGVHSGKQITITLKPAKANTGIIFVRTDQDPEVSIPANNKYVIDTRLSTCIGKDNVSISTIEHLLSAIAGLGIDNLIIEINNKEIPIMDGSASPFIFLLKSAGIQEQKGFYKKFIKIKKTITIEKDDKKAILLPFDGFKIDMSIDFNHPEINHENNFYSIDFSSMRFTHEISRARTFGFLADLEFLKQQNLILGGSLKNAIVLDENKILNPEGLRFKDELVKHKILDVIGDLCLFGMPIIGHFTGIKSGHMLNDLLIKKTIANQDSWEIVSFNTPKACPIKFDI